MGARLVSLALQPDWATLSPNARLVFITMCQMSQDRDNNGHPPRTYWGGHGTLAALLFGSEEDASLRKVRRAIAELTDAGAVELLHPAHRRRQATYLVAPDNWPKQDKLT